MTKGIEWEHYRTFLAVLTEGSLSGAARRLGIAQPTVGRHVSALEAAFGQALFTRTQAGLVPTETAKALRGYAESMQHMAAALERVAATRFDVDRLRRHADAFSRPRYLDEMRAVIDETVAAPAGTRW